MAPLLTSQKTLIAKKRLRASSALSEDFRNPLSTGFKGDVMHKRMGAARGAKHPVSVVALYFLQYLRKHSSDFKIFEM